MATPTPPPENNTSAPPPLTVSAPEPDTLSSSPPAPDSVTSPVSNSPPPSDARSPSSDTSSPPLPALAPPPDTEAPPPDSASPPATEVSPPPPSSTSSPSPPPPSTSSPSPPPPSTSSPSPPPPSTSSPPPSSDSSPPPATSSPPPTSASPPPPSSSPPTFSVSPPPPLTSSPPTSSTSPPPPTSSPPSSFASPPPPTTSSPPSSSASSPPPSSSSPPSSTASPPPTFSASPPASTFPSSPSFSPSPPSTSSPPTSSYSPTIPPVTSSPPTPNSSASLTPPPSASSPPISSKSSTPPPSSFLPPTSSAYPPPPPLTSSTSPSLLLSPPSPLNLSSIPINSSSSGISIAVVAGIAIGGVAILLVLILLLVCYRKKRRNEDAEAFHAQPPFAKDISYGGPLPGPIVRLMSNASSAPGNAPQFLLPSINSTGSIYSGQETPSPGSVLGSSKSSFSYEELAQATNGFSEANLLGQGGFGYVHKGVLPNGKEVAIKQLKAGSGQGEREFQAEVEIISRVHHKHLVSLVGYCIAGSQRLLVYEYIPNNNLEFHLHEKGRPTMDWSARVRIALGSAKGLAYLHEDCNPKIIHRDIKAANILLDFKFDAKVADFGLAKFTSDIHTHVSTRVMGTFGYLAPEYASSGKLSDKSDVFSFGVVLLELITGHRPVDTTQTFMEDSLVDWARPLLVRAIEDENYDGLVDPKLKGNFIPAVMARMVACAAACVRHSAKRRPRMIQVVRALEGDATLADLNKGVGQQGHSTASSEYDTTQYKEDMKKFRRMALESQEYGATGVAYSAGTSEYGLYPSSSSSSDAQTSREMDTKRWPTERVYY